MGQSPVNESAITAAAFHSAPAQKEKQGHCNQTYEAHARKLIAVGPKTEKAQCFLPPPAQGGCDSGGVVLFSTADIGVLMGN